MKNLFALFLMVSVLAVFALPVLAVTPIDPPASKGLRLPVAADTPQSGAELVTVVETVTNWVFAVFVVLTVIFILLAAFQFITGGGDEAKISEARQKLIWAAVGIIVALASKGLVPVVRSIIGATGV